MTFDNETQAILERWRRDGVPKRGSVPEDVVIGRLLMAARQNGNFDEVLAEITAALGRPATP